jgi:hypothetical protein
MELLLSVGFRPSSWTRTSPGRHIENSRALARTVDTMLFVPTFETGLAAGTRRWGSADRRDPSAVIDQALAARAMEVDPVHEQHGWLLGRIDDPFGYLWEVGKPLGDRPPVADDPSDAKRGSPSRTILRHKRFEASYFG